MIPIICFIGHHNSGKTHILTVLVERLTERGLRVGAIKHAPNLESTELAGSDSKRLRAAGANRTLLWSRCEAVLRFPPPSAVTALQDIERLFFDCDLVLVEGLKHGPFPKIEVYRRTATVPRQPLAGEVEVLAVVTDDSIALPDGTRRFAPADVDTLADFLETQFLAG